VHGRGFESLTFGVYGDEVHVMGSNLCLFVEVAWRKVLISQVKILSY
jgi:hypothetical protein